MLPETKLLRRRLVRHSGNSTFPDGFPGPNLVSLTELALPVHLLFVGTPILLLRNCNPVHNGVCPASRSYKKNEKPMHSG